MIKTGLLKWIMLFTWACVFSCFVLACSGNSGTSDGGPDADGSGGQRLSPIECLLALDCPQVMVAAHRGLHIQHPENSISAIRASAAIDVDFVEVDVRHTSDQQLILMHDSDLDRTTDGSGDVDQMTWAQIQELNLTGGDPQDPEDSKVPLFSQALQLADQLGIMLYVDQKTSRSDLVLAAIQEGEYYQVALVRDSLSEVAQMLAQDDKLLVMPAVESLAEFQTAQETLATLVIVELGVVMPDPDFNTAVHAAGVKVQQDVMAAGDLLALLGDYSGWKDFVDAEVDLMQTDYGHLLVPAIREYEETGIFPEEGPAPGD
ncbi:MAG: glycerophosphodiester phosphodiesterase family protein [Deltaproteobacteria bacterium]|nr:glycerophosphodiester phosphodiesterase family protein [Deltaproteobacteria bacterium]